MSNISIPKTRFIDHLNFYFPATVGQFTASAPSESSYPYTPKISKGRVYCARHLAISTFLSPLYIANFLAQSLACGTIEIGKIVVITCTLPWKFSEDRVYWLKTALSISDCMITSVASPLQHCFVCSRLALGIIKPSSYFRKEPFLLNDRLDGVLKKNSFDVADIPPEDTDNAKILSNRAFISALYNYSKRWGLISTSEIPNAFYVEHSKGFYVTKKFLNKQRDDKVEEKYHLLKAFHEFLQEPEKFEKNKEIIKFIEENFNTPRQKVALKMFLKKNPSQIIRYSDIPSIKEDADVMAAIETLLNKSKQ